MAKCPVEKIPLATNVHPIQKTAGRLAFNLILKGEPNQTQDGNVIVGNAA